MKFNRYRYHPADIPLKNENGLALIIVLGVVSLFTVLSGMLISSSKVAGINSKINVDRSRAKYAAESATAFTHWMVMNYNYNRPAELIEEDSDEEAWLADGTSHKLNMVDGLTAEVKIFDVNRGWNILQLRNEKSKLINRYALEDDEKRENFERFFAVFNDYIDRDNKNRSHPDYGMENDDYDALDYENFPRNSSVVFREEMYWLDGVKFLVPNLGNFELATALPDDLFRVIAPRGIADPGSNQYSFWSAPMHWLESNSGDGFSSSEENIIKECREKGFIDELNLQECLGFDLYSKLKSIRGLSFDPKSTQVYTIDVTVSSANGEISRRMVSTMNLKNLPAFVGNSDVGSITILPYWQKIFY